MTIILYYFIFLTLHYPFIWLKAVLKNFLYFFAHSNTYLSRQKISIFNVC